ncbi:hypothetical protein GGI15_001269 [Coemansia interrupta]|uniref:RRM domain-containing protein n=1 Tax=Coemansia interrupta TaxID=1126814 RepID=A0A9W8LLJ9_9FUNG|nr:hypothetical protein GGI15_001269 [Coemansia interrupta]
MSASPETTTAPAATEVPKVFVGNLSFKTTDGQLKDFFSDVGEVKEARIVTRGPRSMGYGFVSYGDIETVNKAVAAKNQAELDGRPLNVEVARVPTKEEAAERAASKSARRRQPRRKAAAAADGEAKTDSDAVEAAQPSAASENSGEDAKAAKAGANRRNTGRRTRRFPKKEKSPAEGSTAPAASTPAPAAAAPKVDATPSETVTFIGNLPFSTTDEELSKLFAGFSITAAHVVIAKKNQRPKGFGFVTFANNEEQTRAIKQFGEQPLVVAERVLSIKPALSESPAADQASEGEAAAAASAAAPASSA